MKLALITDTHWGVRNDNPAFLDNAKRFLDDVFFPYLIKHQIDTVIHLGDLVDRRKYVNYYTAQRMRTDFINPLMGMVKEFHWILGNHDIYFRDTNEVSAASELFPRYKKKAGKYETFMWYDAATEVEFDGTKILFVPWICSSNRDQTDSLIKSTDARVLFGHLQLAGFEMYKGVMNKDGDALDQYRKFDMVATGHYHHKSSVGNIEYLGAHGEFTWQDHNDPRGFHIFDTATRSLEYIQNPYPMFAKVFYDDSNGTFERVDFKSLEGKIIKVVVKAQNNTDQFNWFVSQIEAVKPQELIFVQDHLNLDMVTDEDIGADVKDTLTLMLEYADKTDHILNSTKLTGLLNDLYREAIELE